MIAGWVLHLFATAAVLAAAGWAGERAAVAHDGARRWPWVAALAGTLLLPPVLLLVVQGLGETGLTMTAGVENTASAAAEGAPVSVGADPSGGPPPGVPSMTAWLRAASPWAGAIWAAWSAVAVARVGRLWRRTAASGEPVGRIDGAELRRTDDLGPAVAGWRTPLILLPGWYFDLPDEERDLVLRHEREHVRAGDHQLLWAASLITALMPWNVPLRWSAHRLREAVELDCDRRTVSDDAERSRYGRVLLDASQRSSADVRYAAWEDGSVIGRRVRALLGDEPDGWLTPALASAGAAVLLAADVALVGGMTSAGALGEGLANPFGGGAADSTAAEASIHCGGSPWPAASERARLTVHRSARGDATLLLVRRAGGAGEMEIGAHDFEREWYEVELAVESTSRELACRTVGLGAEADIRAEAMGDTVRIRVSENSSLRVEDRLSGRTVVLGRNEDVSLPAVCRVAPGDALACLPASEGRGSS